MYVHEQQAHTYVGLCYCIPGSRQVLRGTSAHLCMSLAEMGISQLSIIPSGDS